MKATNTLQKFSRTNNSINYECYNMIELMCLKKLMLTKSLVCVSVLTVITGTFLRLILDFSQKYTLVTIF